VADRSSQEQGEFESRENLVIQSDSFLKNARFDLSTMEQKVLIILVSKIDPEDAEIKEIEADVRDFLQIVETEKEENTYYRIMEVIQSLADKSWWISDESSKNFAFCKWIDTAEISKESGKIKVKFHESIKFHIRELKENFAQYRMLNAIILRSKYSLRLYEIFKSYLQTGRLEISVDDLKNVLNISENIYKRFYDFKKYVLIRPIQEINELTDIKVSFSQLKKGKSIVNIVFVIREKYL